MHWPGDFLEGLLGHHLFPLKQLSLLANMFYIPEVALTASSSLENVSSCVNLIGFFAKMEKLSSPLQKLIEAIQIPFDPR
jgi:hypothetical protein